jgi:hypothetical protein
VDRGLISSSEVTAGQAAQSMLERQYAVLLWQAFGQAFPVTSGSAEPALGGLDPQEAAALQGLRRVEVVRDSDGPFVPDRPLDSERERLLLDRMHAALRGEVLP